MRTTLPILSALLLCATTVPASEQPNVLFLAVDDLRPELAVYGAAVKTPNLDRLAATGIRFDRAYCQQAVCGASRLSIMGGLYPTKTKEQNYHVTGWRERHPDLLTLQQHFRNEGYRTVGIGKIYHGTGGPGVDPENWDEWMTATGPTYALQASMAGALENRRANPDRDPADFRGTTTEMADVEDAFYADGARALAAAEKLAELAAGEAPFFFAAGFNKPHLPFVAPKRYWDLYERDSFRLPPNLSWPPGYPDYARNPTAGEMRRYSDYEGRSPLDFSDEFNRRLLHGYAACVSYTDANVGRVLDALESSGAAGNTIVVFWGDHGWKLGDHSSWCKHTNFEVDTRVPLLMRVPGGPAGETVSSPVELIDLYPTLCELAGLPVPGHVQGESFAGLFEDLDSAHRASAYSSYPHGGVTGHSIRMGDYRYTEWIANGSGETEVRVLTDLAEDPGEESNVLDDPARAEDLAKLEDELKERISAALR